MSLGAMAWLRVSIMTKVLVCTNGNILSRVNYLCLYQSFCCVFTWNRETSFCATARLRGMSEWSQSDIHIYHCGTCNDII